MNTYIHECGSIRNSSRVPRYQNQLKVGGFCDFQVKPCSNDWKRVWEKVRSLPYEGRLDGWNHPYEGRAWG
jgi:hypothetical protein